MVQFSSYLDDKGLPEAEDPTFKSKPRATLCISSQIGCSMGCVFLLRLFFCCPPVNILVGLNVVCTVCIRAAIEQSDRGTHVLHWVQVYILCDWDNGVDRAPHCWRDS